MLPTMYCLSLCIDWDPHSLFHFCKCVSFSTYYHIEEIEHIYNSREQNASISSLSLGFFFLSLSFYVPKHFPSWKIRKYFHWIKVSPVLKQLAWIQPELHFNTWSAALPYSFLSINGLISNLNSHHHIPLPPSFC